MPTLKFTNALKRFFPDLKDTPANGTTIAAVLQELNGSYPGIHNYLLDDQGKLRKHVNIFIDGTMLSDRADLEKLLDKNCEVFIIQALSGG